MLMMWRRTFAALAKPKIIKMCTNDKYNSHDEKRNFVLREKLF